MCIRYEDEYEGGSVAGRWIISRVKETKKRGKFFFVWETCCYLKQQEDRDPSGCVQYNFARLCDSCNEPDGRKRRGGFV
jgi:hypothetical protein